jgi:transcriptional regulator NrdR family protein
MSELTCPFCLHYSSKVVDSRSHPYREARWRKRRCESCGQTFETEETVSTASSWFWKRWSRDRLTPHRVKMLHGSS